MENRILEAVPSQVADSIVIGLTGAETKYELLVLIKDVMVKKKSIFLYRSDLHKLTQQRSELPERFARGFAKPHLRVNSIAILEQLITVKICSAPYSS